MTTETETKPKLRKGQIDYTPVLEAVERRGGFETALAEVGINRGDGAHRRMERTFFNAKERGHASVFHVDEMCCVVLKKHPAELYGEEWFTA